MKTRLLVLSLQGVHGIAMARLCHGLVALRMYAPLARALGGARALSFSAGEGL
jgi:hypothetical protein